MITSEEK